MRADSEKKPGSRRRKSEYRQKPGKQRVPWLIPILGLALVLGGAAVFLYPVVSNYLAEKNQTRVIQNYQESVSELDEAEITEQWRIAEEYNENLAGDPVHDPFVPGSGYALPDNYLDVLNVDGVMGYIEIPKIEVDLPIYHGTSEETLEKGVGHMESTTLPIGGTDRHCVLTGHRGLPSAELFTNLNLLEIGDYFYIRLLDQTLAYEVERIETVEPDELELLTVEPGKDLVTLITCTPYGVNTHRLLVTGARTDAVPAPEDAGDTPDHVFQWTPLLYGAAGVLAGVILLGVMWLIFLLFKRRRNRKEREGSAAQKEAKQETFRRRKHPGRKRRKKRRKRKEGHSRGEKKKV